MTKKRIITTDNIDEFSDNLPLCLEKLGLTGYGMQINQELVRCSKEEGLTPEQILTRVLARVIFTRDEHKAAMLMKMARFPTMLQTLERFNFSRLTDKRIPAKIHELAGCGWIRNKTNLYFQGNPGLGKKHLSIGLGIKATQKAYSTLFMPAKELFRILREALKNGGICQSTSKKHMRSFSACGCLKQLLLLQHRLHPFVPETPRLATRLQPGQLAVLGQVPA